MKGGPKMNFYLALALSLSFAYTVFDIISKIEGDKT